MYKPKIRLNNKKIMRVKDKSFRHNYMQNDKLNTIHNNLGLALFAFAKCRCM